MSKALGTIILGADLRGLWLATELAKLGESCTWMQIAGTGTLEKSQFHISEFPFEFGWGSPEELQKKWGKFVSEVIQPEYQELGFQILTSKGVFSLGGPYYQGCLDYFFGEKSKEYKQFFNALKKGEEKGISAHLLPLTHSSENKNRWIMKCLSEVSDSHYPTDVLDPLGFVDPHKKRVLMTQTKNQILEKAVSFAKAKGVDVRLGVKLSDVGYEAQSITGVEVLGAEGFIRCKDLIVCADLETLYTKVPRLKKVLKRKRPENEFVFGRMTFALESGQRPSGVHDYSFYVDDTVLPLYEDGFLISRFVSDENKTFLNCWVKLPFQETKRLSYLTSMNTQIEGLIKKIFPKIHAKPLKSLKLEDYFQNSLCSDDNRFFVVNGKCQIGAHLTPYRNMYLSLPHEDHDLTFEAGLESEKKVLSVFQNRKEKEIQRDRKIHSSRNGRDLVKNP